MAKIVRKKEGGENTRDRCLAYKVEYQRHYMKPGIHLILSVMSHLKLEKNVSLQYFSDKLALWDKQMI